MIENPKINVEHLTFTYDNHIILDDVSILFEAQKITAITGASGRGKTTFLTILNRLWETENQAKMKGKISILFKDIWQDIYAPSFNKYHLRRKVGMVFQNPNPLPMSIIRNVTFPLKLMGEKNNQKIREKAEMALKKAYLWDEVKDRLESEAMTLSGGQQQRLCIARALILEPEILLLDEPTSSLDATSSSVIENLLLDLKDQCTILMVSHYLDQIKRIADRTIEISGGKFIV